MTSAWKRRLVVAGLQAAALALVSGYLFATRPNAQISMTNLGNAIQVLNKDNAMLQKTTLEMAYKEAKAQTGLGEVLLVTAFFLGAAATVTGLVWGFVEQRRDPALPRK